MRLPVSTLSLLVICGLLTSCKASRKLADPTLQVETAAGSELGVSTDYGIVFLGHTSRSGPVTVTAWFGDGPSVEASVIEPLGGGLYTAETEIRLPITHMSYETPIPGQELVIMGRKGRTVWRTSATVLSDRRVEGILLEPVSELRNAPDQIGAGVYVIQKDGRELLVGLVSGTLELSEGGNTRQYLTVMGPEELWRLVTFRREMQRKRRWVYREDIL